MAFMRVFFVSALLYVQKIFHNATFRIGVQLEFDQNNNLQI